MNALEHWIDLIAAAAGSFISAAVGIAMRHAHEVQQGKPWPTWKRLALNTPTLLVMAVAGDTIGQWLHTAYGMPELSSSVLAANLGYLGPASIDRFAVWLEARKPGASSDEGDK